MLRMKQETGGSSGAPRRPLTVEIVRIDELPQQLASLERGDAVRYQGWIFELGGGVQGLDAHDQPIVTRRIWVSGPNREFDAFRGFLGAEFERLKAMVCNGKAA